MACAIEATAKDIAANAYLTIVEADDYFAERIHADEWVALSPDNKCRMLVWATRLLDQWVSWLGVATTFEQALDWPRWGLYTNTGDVLDQDLVPEGVKQAVCELAWNLRLEDLTMTPDQTKAGLSSLTAGPVSLSFFGPTQGRISDADRIIASNVMGPIRLWVSSVASSGFAGIPLGRA